MAALNVQNDKTLDIAVGNSRKTKMWKNRTIAWSELLQRFVKPTVTPETMAEYRAMSREDQSQRKDVGGFVGGYCNNGSRSDVRHRSILCLDADYADDELWSDWELLGYVGAMYSTHKHTPEKPRLRLVVPLARNVDPEEYQAVGRRIAAMLGIDKFDDSTYEAGRFMYWPSCSSDGEYVFKQTGGQYLDPDRLLATYHDWHDVSSWPMSSRVAEIAKRSAAKQKDPLEKEGLVGAFCRAYTIQEAIEAFIPSYTPCTEPNRYTYTEGSTSAGVIVYEDKFAYSHHATDPAAGQLCNAWDLVRLHLFHDKDENCDADTKPASRPSYKAMVELAKEDALVKQQIVKDRRAEAMADFAEPCEEGENWEARLRLGKTGEVLATINNVELILTNDPQLSGRLAFNELRYTIALLNDLPWRKAKPRAEWEDADESALRGYLERWYRVENGAQKINDALVNIAHTAEFHPIREYLDGCEWDGVPRVDTLLVDCLGADDTPYTRAVTRKTLVAAVARIYRPGVKFDYMLTLHGAQGIGKSTLIAKLGGPWYSDTFTNVQGKDAFEQLQGVWLMEVGELDGMRKAEASTIKHFLSKTSDRYRPAYGRRTMDFPRQCVFFGTTNEPQFLRDATGNRRFWIVNTPNATAHKLMPALAALDDETVRQIWGEAKALYKAGETLYLPAELDAAAIEIQEAYQEENPKVGLIDDYLERLLPRDWDNKDIYERRQWLETNAKGTVRRKRVCAMEIYAEALGGDPRRQDRYDVLEVNSIMANMPGWERRGNKVGTFPIYGRQRYYERIGG